MSAMLALVFDRVCTLFLPQQPKGPTLFDELTVLAEGDLDIAVDAITQVRESQKLPRNHPVELTNVLSFITGHANVRAIREFRSAVGLFPVTHTNLLPYSFELHRIGRTDPDALTGIFSKVKDALQKDGPISFDATKIDAQTLQANHTRLQIALRNELVAYGPALKAA